MSNSLLSQIIENINNSKFHEAEQLAWELYNKSNNDFAIIKTLALTLLLQNKYNGSINPILLSKIRDLKKVYPFFLLQRMSKFNLLEL